MDSILPSKWQQILNDVPPTEFIETFLQCIYCNNINKKREIPSTVQDEATVHHYWTKFCRTELPQSNNPSEVVTIIPTSAYNVGKDANIWDSHEEEKNLKKEMTIKERLELIASHNSNYSSKAEEMEENKYDKKTDSNLRYNFGVYNKRELAYEYKMIVDDVDKISNTLLVAFLVKKTGKYSTEEAEDKVVEERENENIQLYWNGSVVDQTMLQYKKIRKTDKCIYESNKLTVKGLGFERKRIAFYRIGDFLTMNEIQRMLDVCREYSHAIPVFLAICCSHRLCEYFFIKEEQEKESIAANRPLDGMPQKVRQALSLAESLMSCIKKTLIEKHEDFDVADFIRCNWITWANMSAEHDKLYQRETARKRQRLRKRIIKDVRESGTFPDEVDDDIIQEEINLLHYFLIMLITQQSTDASSETIFRQISHNFTTVKSYLAPLKTMSFCELFECYTEIIRQRSLYTLKASCLLNSLVVIEVLFNGKMPRDYEELRGFRQMGKKKAFITLNTLKGIFLAVGTDSHVMDLIKACCLDGKLSDSDAFYITENMGEDPGAFFNELAAEIRQAFNDKDTRIHAGHGINGSQSYRRSLHWRGWDNLTMKF